MQQISRVGGWQALACLNKQNRITSKVVTHACCDISFTLIRAKRLLVVWEAPECQPRGLEPSRKFGRRAIEEFGQGRRKDLICYLSPFVSIGFGRFHCTRPFFAGFFQESFPKTGQHFQLGTCRLFLAMAKRCCHGHFVPPTTWAFLTLQVSSFLFLSPTTIETILFLFLKLLAERFFHSQPRNKFQFMLWSQKLAGNALSII